MSSRIVLGATLALAVTAGIVAGAAPARAQSSEWNALFDRIIRLEHEVRSMNQGGGQPAGTSGSEEIRQLRAQVEALSQQVQQLQREILALKGARGQLQQPSSRPQQMAVEESQPVYQDEAQPQYSLETQGPTPLGTVVHGAPQTIGPPKPTGAGPQVLGQLRLSGEGAAPTQAVPAQPGVSRNLLPEEVETAALDDPMSGTGSTASAASEGGAAGSAAEALYKQAHDNLLRRRFGLAEAGFRNFISRHKDHELADEAQFWLGETYYVQGRYKQAAQSFLTGYKTFPDSERAGPLLLKLGMSLNRLGQTAQACNALSEVRRNYAGDAQTAAQAKREMQSAGCS